MAKRIFDSTTLTAERRAFIMRTGNGCFTYDLRNATVSDLQRISIGFTDKALKLMVGHLVICDTATILDEKRRAKPIPEQFTENELMHISLDGSFNFQLLHGRFSRPYGNNIFEFNAAICLDCGAKIQRDNYSAHVCGERLCSCGAPLKSNDEKRFGYCFDCAKAKARVRYDYHYRPHRSSPLFEKSNDRFSKLHLGVEIEVDGNARTGLDYEAFCFDVSEALNTNPFYPFIEFERDGSLNDGGTECITAPTTFSTLASNLNKFATLYDKADEYGGIFDKANGLHFHIDRDYFGFGEENQELRAKGLILIESLIYKYYDFFMLISRRKEGCTGYAVKKHEVNGLYSACLNVHYQEHSFAVNGSNDNTIEIRFFGGKIASASDFIACADIIQAIATWAKKTSLSRAEKATPSAIIPYIKNLENVLRFVKHTRTDSPTTEFAKTIHENFIKDLTKRIKILNAKTKEAK